MERRNYNSLDLCKFIMAFAVVAIHTHPLEICTNDLLFSFYKSFTAIAVPFFFIAAGFLLGRKLDYPIINSESNNKVILKYMLKILKMYLFWTVIYLPLAIYNLCSTSKNLTRAILTYAKGLFFTGEHYNSWHLWYLLSTIYALVLLMVLIKHNKSIYTIVIIGAVIYVLSIIITYFSSISGDLPSYLIVLQKVIKHTISNGKILTGMFYIPIGILLSKKTLPIKVSWMILVIAYISNVLVDSIGISSIFEAVSAIALFGVFSSINLPDSIVYSRMRKISTVVYFIHLYIWSFYYIIVYGKKTYGLDCYLVTSVVCLLIGVIFTEISKYKNKNIPS